MLPCNAQPWVRFAIFQNLWHFVMPKQFLNNLSQARCVMAMAVAGMHATKFWDGEGPFSTGFPITWAWAREHNTGKSKAQLFACAITGQYHAGLWAGDASAPAIYERLDQQCDLTLQVEDLVPNKDGDSYKQKVMVRTVYDDATRVVYEKSRTPQSSYCVSVSAPSILTHLPSPPSLPGLS